MSTALIPIPTDTASWSTILFHIAQPVTLTAEQFDLYWPMTSTVYTKIGGLLLQQNGTVEVQKYECRLRKSKKGGNPPVPKNGVKKRYGIMIRQSGLCNVRIKTTRTVSEPITYTIEDSPRCRGKLDGLCRRGS